MSLRRQFFRNFEAVKYFDTFLISAIASVLVIRLYLKVAGYPQLGGNVLHIAHMLWGGMLMLAAMVLLFSFLGRGPKQAAAFIGGIGFGTFIDEIGKFVTHDNDYFFKPSVALIYVIFILVYLVIHAIHRERAATREEYLVNALREVEQAAVRNLDRLERDRALHYLERSDTGDPLVKTLRELLLWTDLVPTPGPRFLIRMRDRLAWLYRRAVTSRYFFTVVATFFIGQLVIKILWVIALVFFDWTSWRAIVERPVLTPFEFASDQSSVVKVGQFASSLLSGVFVALGVLRLRKNRPRGYRMFQHSILVSIFLTQVFMFYMFEWAALTGLVFNVLVFVGLRFMIEHEKDDKV